MRLLLSSSETKKQNKLIGNPTQCHLCFLRLPLLNYLSFSAYSPNRYTATVQSSTSAYKVDYSQPHSYSDKPVYNRYPSPSYIDSSFYNRRSRVARVRRMAPEYPPFPWHKVKELARSLHWINQNKLHYVTRPQCKQECGLKRERNAIMSSNQCERDSNSFIFAMRSGCSFRKVCWIHQGLCNRLENPPL